MKNNIRRVTYIDDKGINGFAQITIQVWPISFERYEVQIFRNEKLIAQTSCTRELWHSDEGLKEMQRRADIYLQPYRNYENRDATN